MLIVLDSGPLGLLSNPTPGGTAQDAQQWARHHIAAGVRFVVPEIADYLAAQARSLQSAASNDFVVVATTNVAHLQRFVDAKYWAEI